MQTQTTARRIGGALGVLTVLGTIALGVYGVLSGSVLDPSTIRPLTTALSGVVVFVAVALAATVGARGGGWLETPYW
ncbi:hypothetical protein Halru_1544 [Halovivax ruber XH-70]|uniref:Uncharacterized protein n=1 Tax=Halovivax ruber (strain DSM 18193 / JCM 13892 / XH-70) TaxID=797302 RepID=L0IDV6_HALRX|nr:hypothetical protein [Halovivax ruber]AGB16152.1 hypothetical protein Halru_1544 [Halovivax ruber XH-70]